MVDGLNVLPLHQFETETAALVRWRPGTQFNRHTHRDGEKIMWSKAFSGMNTAHIRQEFGYAPHIEAPIRHFFNEGCLIYYKTGHFLGEYGTLSDPAERAENSTMSTA
jgi:hypothetical protein